LDKNNIKTREPYHGFCPPGYERVKSFNKKSGEHVREHCRKIVVSGRIKAGISGLYNEGMIAQEDVRLGFDSIVDSTHEGEKNAQAIKKRADSIEKTMKEQEKKKEEIRKGVK
jgi:predicted DNA-binding transcriptional regulator